MCRYKWGAGNCRTASCSARADQNGAQEAAGQRPAAHVPIKMGRRKLQDPWQDTVLQQMPAEKWGAGKRRTSRRTMQDTVLQQMFTEKWGAGKRRTPHPIWGYKNIKAGGVGVGVSGRVGRVALYPRPHCKRDGGNHEWLEKVVGRSFGWGQSAGARHCSVVGGAVGRRSAGGLVGRAGGGRRGGR